MLLYWDICCWDSAVCIVTHYRLDDLWIKCWWAWDFLHPSKPDLGHNQPPAQWVPGLFPWGKAALTIHPHIAPRLKKQYSYTPIPLWAFIAYSRVKFTFQYFRLININGNGEDSRFLRHDAMLFGNYYPTFWTIIVPSASFIYCHTQHKQLYHKENQQPLRHPVRTVLLITAIKETHFIYILYLSGSSFWFSMEFLIQYLVINFSST
jgi:hypothetical protein